LGSDCLSGLGFRGSLVTNDNDVRDLVKKIPGTDLLREMIGFAAKRLMELEIGTVTGAIAQSG